MPRLRMCSKINLEVNLVVFFFERAETPIRKCLSYKEGGNGLKQWEALEKRDMDIGYNAVEEHLGLAY